MAIPRHGVSSSWSWKSRIQYLAVLPCVSIVYSPIRVIDKGPLVRGRGWSWSVELSGVSCSEYLVWMVCRAAYEYCCCTCRALFFITYVCIYQLDLNLNLNAYHERINHQKRKGSESKLTTLLSQPSPHHSSYPYTGLISKSRCSAANLSGQ